VPRCDCVGQNPLGLAPSALIITSVALAGTRGMIGSSVVETARMGFRHSTAGAESWITDSRAGQKAARQQPSHGAVADYRCESRTARHGYVRPGGTTFLRLYRLGVVGALH
jgi:hypothetical protein